MGRLSNKEFLDQFSALLSTTDGKSSVYLTQKRLSPVLDLDNDSSHKINDLSSNVVDSQGDFPQNEQKYPLLIRITNGSSTKSKVSKVKLLTVVETADLDEFWVDYLNTIKTGFVGLKKKEKKKSRKTKVTK